jgi:hypothetical protein
MAKTLAQVVASVRRRFQRWDTEIEAELNSYLSKEVVQDICRTFPFWFLKIQPGSVFPAAFFPGDETDLALATPVVGNWLDRGWLYLETGVSNYKVWSPAAAGPDHDTTANKWFATPLQKFDYAIQYNLQGHPAGEFEVYNHTDSRRSQNMMHYGSSGCATSLVWENVTEGGEEVAYIRVQPTPETDGLIAVCYTLAYPANFTSGSSTTNRFFTSYYEAAVAAGIIFVAEYFGDAVALEKAEHKLYGIPGAPKSKGLIGKMRKDTIVARTSDMNTMPGHPSPMQAGYRRARPGRFGWT